MNAIFKNSRNSKASDPHRLLLNLTDRTDLRGKAKPIALSNLSIQDTYKNIKKSYKNNRFKYELKHGTKSLNYLMDHILY